jgi:mannan endo-1,6-alpha-mannosidase
LLSQLIEVFYQDGVAVEIACETEEKLTCTPDMFSFKGYVLRWLATVAQLAPFTKDRILNLMMTTTKAAIRQCSGGGPPGYGRTCGFRWNRAEYDGTHGAGQQMNVLGALSALLFTQASGPLTNLTGGTSLGDYNAGSDSDFRPRDITMGDKAGAGILTVLLLILVTSTFGWMSTEFFEGKLD